MKKSIRSKTLEEEFEEYIQRELGEAYYREDYENFSMRWEYAFESKTELDSCFIPIGPDN